MIDIEEGFKSFGDSARCTLREVQSMIKRIKDPDSFKLEQKIKVKDSKGIKSDSMEEGVLIVEDGVIKISTIYGGKDAQPDKSLRMLFTFGVNASYVMGAGAGVILLAGLAKWMQIPGSWWKTKQYHKVIL